jgi:hypothetical protein
MFGNLQGIPASLNDFSAYLWDEHQIEISKQGVDDRFNSHAVNFLKRQLQEEMNNKLDFSNLHPLSSSFSSIRIKDSTKWNLPEAYSDKYKGHGGCRANGKAMISVQFDYDLLAGGFIDLSLTSGTRNDQQDSKEVKDNIGKNELLIRDLGYATIGYMKNVEDKQAFFLNKMSLQFAVYDLEKGKEVDFKAIQRKLKKNNLQQVEQNVLVGSKERFACRMIVTTVPQEVYKARIEAAEKNARKRGYQLTDTYKTRAAMNIYLTNAPDQLLPAKNVMDIYRIRWQVELMFKVWKSLANVNAIGKMKMVRFEAQLLAKLIWILINWKIFFALNGWVYHQDAEQMCSIWKFYKQIIRTSSQLRDILWEDGDWAKWLSKLFTKAHRNLLIEKKKNKKAFYEHFNLLMDLA